MSSKAFRKFYRENSNENSRGVPRGLVVAEVDDSNKNLKIGFSFCSRKDSFKRQLAHTIANSRLASNKWVASLNDDNSINNLKNQMPDGAKELAPIIDEAVKYFRHRKA